ncbi:TonB-dependent receptor [Marinimicrobium sp. ARAG 43.8]|uniref:TonB-dependent receptor n=1 Tax=Marinimicrobium sp. ARAG 43.8 TaxID=3418719 RepID=UPI003CE9FFA1
MMTLKPLAQAIRTRGVRRGLWLTGSLAAVALQAPALAQNAAPQRAIEEVVVTGTPGGAAMRKLDASFAISTVSAEDIKRKAPSSTADLLKTVPGVWVESSGGVSGANIFVRGFPSGGDADFVTVALNGLAVYPPPTLSFLENSTLFRVDETIERMEGLRGGPNPVYSNGQVGLTTNFILKEGGPETEGVIKYSTSDFGLQRIDGMVSGELADDFYYMIGGYISSSEGVRQAGFDAEEGNQFTINLTKILDNGKINLFHRATDDHGTWYLPVALQDTGGNPTGIDAEYTQVGAANRNVLVPITGPDGMGGSQTTFESYDMGKGRGWDGSITGGSVELDLNHGWTLTDRFSLTSGAANTYGFVPDGPAQTMGSLNGGSAGTNISGDAVAANALVQRIGPWVVEKDVEAFSNDLSLAKQWDSYKLTLGYYASSWEVDEMWSIGNAKYYELRHNGQMISPDSVADACQDFDQATCGFKYDVDAVGDARENAFYMAAETYLGPVTLDAGVRAVTRETHYSVDDGERDGIADLVLDTKEDKVTYTAAANLSLTEDSGVFVRINDGVKFPDFDAYRDFRGDFLAGSDLIIDVTQYELGYKLSKANYSLYATGFYNETKGQPFGNVALNDFARLETEAMGVELDGSLFWGNFELSLNGTFQNTEIKSGDDSGNKVQRQPDSQVRLSPSYNLQFANGVDAIIYGTASLIGDRYGDNANINKLDSYEKLDLGVIVNIDNLELQLVADNLTDEMALTESDPRSAGVSANGRYILPRNVKFSIAYHF